MGKKRPELYEPGWPRPRWKWNKSVAFPRMERAARKIFALDKLPIPWINAPNVVEDDDWHSFRPDCLRAHHERLCVVCGEPLNERILLGAMGGERETAGPGGHPRCIWLAINTCPHLIELSDHWNQTVAWEYIGPDTGYEFDPDGLRRENYGSGEKIVQEARRLTRKQAKEIALADPLGLSTDRIDGSVLKKRILIGKAG